MGISLPLSEGQEEGTRVVMGEEVEVEEFEEVSEVEMFLPEREGKGKFLVIEKFKE